MSDLTDYLENKLVDHATGRTAYTKPTNTYLALFTELPGEGGAGVEVSGAGYARKVLAWSAAANGVSTNSTAVSYTPTGMTYGSIKAIGVFDALSGGNLLFFKPIIEFPTFVGVPIQFGIGDITFQMK